MTYTYPVFTGRFVKVTGPGTYAWYNGKKLGRGTYRYAGGRDVVVFKTGPLRGKTAKHVRYGNGTHGLTIVFRTASGPSNYACSRT